MQILVKIVHFVIKAPNLVEISSIMQESISDMEPAPKLGLTKIKRMFCKWPPSLPKVNCALTGSGLNLLLKPPGYHIE